MHYDVTSKMLIEKGQKEILRRLVGLAVLESELIEEVPQETASLMRSDFPIKWTNEKGQSQLVLLEIQTRWEKDVPRRLLAYRSRYQLKYDLDAISCVLLLRPSRQATNHYRDQEISYQFKLVRVYEFDSQVIIDQGVLPLMPFVPLMRHGKRLVHQADQIICESPLPKEEKSVMLSAMFILTAMVSSKLADELLKRRKDLMLDSPGYEIFKKFAYKTGKEEGKAEGRAEGKAEGKAEGRAEGRAEGKAEGIAVGRTEGAIRISRQYVIDLIRDKFGPVPRKILQSLNSINDLDLLKSMVKMAAKAESLDKFKKGLEEALSK
ncbi:MAG: hypothetical protein HQK58_17130 [Deltaproteobacteria bacterium]|nr:hypothetical protein [Deltaproteobacteria bacterium]